MRCAGLRLAFAAATATAMVMVGACASRDENRSEPMNDARSDVGAEVSREDATAQDRLTPVPKLAEVPAASGSGNEETPPPLQLRAFLPSIRLDAAARVVEFDGVVPIDAHDERAPYVYLEVLACSRDTREHEAVVVTDAKPSQVHAALLAIGLEPGKPGSYSWQGERVQANPPTGPRVRVEVIVGDGQGVPLTDWAVNVRSGETLTAALREAGHAMLFAGSVSIERERGASYLGDGAGTLVGLSTFGTETVACEALFNPDSAVEEPVWIANSALVPKAGTPVRVRIWPE